MTRIGPIGAMGKVRNSEEAVVTGSRVRVRAAAAIGANGSSTPGRRIEGTAPDGKIGTAAMVRTPGQTSVSIPSTLPRTSRPPMKRTSTRQASDQRIT
jgi:hypothetical protein